MGGSQRRACCRQAAAAEAEGAKKKRPVTVTVTSRSMTVVKVFQVLRRSLPALMPVVYKQNAGINPSQCYTSASCCRNMWRTASLQVISNKAVTNVQMCSCVGWSFETPRSIPFSPSLLSFHSLSPVPSLCHALFDLFDGILDGY